MFPANKPAAPLSQVSTDFLEYARVMLGYVPQSIIKYRDCLRQIEKVFGSRQISTFNNQDLFALRHYMLGKQHSASRQTNIMFALKRLLQYIRDERKDRLAIDPEEIRPPKRPRREVVFLTADEVERLVNSIRLVTYRGQPHLANLRLRALIEVLLGTAMRIGEVLSLNRTNIDFSRREAQIIGKGDKQRVIFFTERALQWLGQYMQSRKGDHPALFVSLDGNARLKRPDIWRSFARLKRASGLSKPVRPHLLRHTAATQLLFNGCPIGHIKEILGHERLETTCRYYLGLDRRAAKAAHENFLVYKQNGGIIHASSSPTNS
ncbi:MAG: xerD [Acidobacteriales bacterium]|nr:xerD [Terriglobales bacterium]